MSLRNSSEGTISEGAAYEGTISEGAAYVDGNTIVFSIRYADMIDPDTQNPLESGEIILIWSVTQFQRQVDHSPNIDDSDGH